MIKIVSWFVVAVIACAIIFPVIARHSENQRTHERYGKMINARFVKIERRGDKALFTPNPKTGYRHMGQTTYKPMLLPVGSKLHFSGADWSPKYVINSIEADGVILRYGESEKSITKVRWK